MKNYRIVLSTLILAALAATGYALSSAKTAPAAEGCCPASSCCSAGASCCGN